MHRQVDARQPIADEAIAIEIDISDLDDRDCVRQHVRAIRRPI
jgi:hypothetical protein